MRKKQYLYQIKALRKKWSATKRCENEAMGKIIKIMAMAQKHQKCHQNHNSFLVPCILRIIFKKFRLKKPSSNHRPCLPPPIWPYGSHISSEVATACYAWLHNFASLWLNDPSWLWPPTKGSKALQKFQTQGSRSWFWEIFVWWILWDRIEHQP